jgi:hypothetical protein
MSREKMLMKYILNKCFESSHYIKASIIIAFSLLVITNLSTSSYSANKIKSYDELLSEGLLLNHTITPIGQRFYKDFVASWTAPKEIADYTIVITERFNPQWGSIAWITVDDNVIFQRSLSARNVQMDDLVQQAVTMVNQYLYRREILNKLQTSEDIKGDGL